MISEVLPILSLREDADPKLMSAFGLPGMFLHLRAVPSAFTCMKHYARFQSSQLCPEKVHLGLTLAPQSN